MQAHALWRVKTAARLSESDLRVISGLQPAKAGFLCTGFSSADAKPRQQKLPQIPGPPAKGFMRSQGSKSCRKVQDPQPRALCEAKAAKAAAKSRTPSQGLYSKPRQQNLLQIPGQPAKGFIAHPNVLLHVALPPERSCKHHPRSGNAERRRSPCPTEHTPRANGTGSLEKRLAQPHWQTQKPGRIQ